MSRIAVVLFNLGGPDGPAAVRPFLLNLFSDPAIIAAPWPLRRVLAEAISRTRRKLAAANYAAMGGASPLLAATEAQAEALQASLAEALPRDEVRCLVAMRYWRPTAAAAARALAAFEPDEVVLLPLYPQFSTTTTASSLAAWRRVWPGACRTICCYFEDEAFIAAHATTVLAAWRAAGSPGKVRVLFSAHGLPRRIAAAGDPYQWQVERTCARIAEQLGAAWDWQVCYQSRVGPLQWIGPSTVEAIERAAADGLGVLVVPVAFVSEHVETLVELDRDYAEVALRVGAEPYLRAPALGCEPLFIAALARLVRAALAQPAGVRPGGESCPSGFSCCALRRPEPGRYPKPGRWAEPGR
ncbi:MAG TPA: ferrochelatase [Caulobacteraceae bacterium]|nr:ferrochelatase [Caulobacteraceae bacterium]